MMTGHEVGAALGVAALTAIAGDLTTRAGLIDAYPTVFTAIAVAMVALSAFAAFAVPSVKASAGGGPGTVTACTDPPPTGRRGREGTPPSRPRRLCTAHGPGSVRTWRSRRREHTPGDETVDPPKPHRPPTTAGRPR